jgi:hypothetical protein
MEMRLREHRVGRVITFFDRAERFAYRMMALGWAKVSGVTYLREVK